ncbi:phosphatidate cytidylyltransferase [Candidatus Saccharibacteria bacterium]|nr:phosphatidate cytidylyltransferase [Candidatus Saccharibacteria bacterium]
MDRNFKVRTIITISMFTVALVGLYTFDSIPFKIIFGFFTSMALIELLSFFKKKHATLNFLLAFFEILFLVCGTIFVVRIDLNHFWYIILGVCGYDIFAYLFGRLFGGKIFKKSRPFPHVSKNKTWEGTFLGLLTSVLLVGIKMGVQGSFDTDWMFLLCGVLALCGDLFESFLKRKFKVKDSNEIIIKNKFFRFIELFVGGSEGHGGFLDRVDSTVFTGTVLLAIILAVFGH